MLLKNSLADDETEFIIRDNSTSLNNIKQRKAFQENILKLNAFNK